MRNLNVLITGAGAPGIMGTIFSLKNQNSFKLKLVGVDAREDVVGKYLLDKTYKVPLPSKEFVKELLTICKKERIDIILPQVTKELIWLAKNEKIFEGQGTKVLVSDHENITKVNNKYELLRACQLNNINCYGKYFLVKSIRDLEKNAIELGYPKNSFVVKLPESSGMRGLRIVNGDFDKYSNFLYNKPTDMVISFKELIDIFKGKKIPNLLMTEYFPGEEYSVDVLADKGKIVVCVPRTRDIMRTGITFEGVTIKNEEIIGYCKKLVHSFNLDFIIGFQFKKDSNGRFKILESNPRVQGTMVHSTFSNANIIAGAVRQAIFGDSGLSQKQVIWGMKLKRYWGAIGDNGKQIIKI